MRFVGLRDGQLELRWTWLPYWLATGPALPREIDMFMRDIVIINGMPPTDESLERIEDLVIRLLQARFKIEGLAEYLRALRHVREP